jgi:large subunit ribosomal protein L22
LNGLRLAPRKVRAVANLIKGKDAVKSLYQLEFMIRRPAPYLIKLLKSAIANAENNFNMVKDNLYIQDIRVNEGMKLKRMRPKGFGRAAMIQKKTSLIQITLAERVAGLKREKKAQTQEKHDHTHVAPKARPDSKKPEIKTEIGKKQNVLGKIGKKIFQRKSI